MKLSSMKRHMNTITLPYKNMYNLGLASMDQFDGLISEASGAGISSVSRSACTHS